MIDENKQPAEFKITKKIFFAAVIINLVILIVGIIIAYFIVTIIHISELNALKEILSNNGAIHPSYDRWMILFARLSSPHEPLNMRNVLIGLAGAVTLVFAGWRLMIADQQKETQVKQTNSQVEQIKIESDRRLNERFDNAVDALSKVLNESSFPSHLGAISSLSFLAINSSENTQRCLDIICSCNQWMEGYIDKFIEKGSMYSYSSQLLNKDNRIVKEDNQNKENQVTLLHERRSQEALVAIHHILEEVSIMRAEQLKELKFHNKMLCGISLNTLKLDGIDFEKAYLVASSLNKTSLKEAKLYGAHLEISSLWGANLQGASLWGAHLQRASLNNVNLQRACLDHAEMQRVSLDHAKLHGASLDNAKLQGASLNIANLHGASLDNAELQGASLDDAKMRGSSLNHAKLQGASLYHTELQGSSLYHAELQGAYLSCTELQGALLIKTQLQGATIYDIDLSNSILLNCNLYGVILNYLKSKSIIFNDIEEINYVIDNTEKRKWLDDISKYMNPCDKKSFTEQMEVAWQAIKNKKEPDGIDIIRENSIVTKDSQGMYDISEKDLAALQKIWQEQVNEKGIKFLSNMRAAISSIDQVLFGYNNQTKDKNVNLKSKLQNFIDELIKNNEIQKNK